MKRITLLIAMMAMCILSIHAKSYPLTWHIVTKYKLLELPNRVPSF